MNPLLTEVIKKHEEYIAWKEKMTQLEEQKRTNLLEEYQVNYEHLKELTYDKLSPIANVLSKTLPYAESNKIKEILDVAYKQKYPLLQVAHYYPQINDIDWLSDTEKNKIDTAVAGSFKRYLNATRLSGLFDDRSDFNVNYQKCLKLFDFLLEKKIVVRNLSLSCNCGETTVMYHSEYEKYKRYYELQEKLTGNTDAPDSLTNEFFNLEEGLSFNFECNECEEGRKISSMKDIDDNIAEYIYRVTIEPDYESHKKQL